MQKGCKFCLLNAGKRLANEYSVRTNYISSLQSIVICMNCKQLSVQYCDVSKHCLATDLNNETITSNHYEVFLPSIILHNYVLMCTQPIFTIH
jgi:hypothetical protein